MAVVLLLMRQSKTDPHRASRIKNNIAFQISPRIKLCDAYLCLRMKTQDDIAHKQPITIEVQILKELDKAQPEDGDSSSCR